MTREYVLGSITVCNYDEGDRYLCAFVQTVQKHLRESPPDYPQRFSCGLAFLPKGHGAVDFDALFR